MPNEGASSSVLLRQEHGFMMVDHRAQAISRVGLAMDIEPTERPWVDLIVDAMALKSPRQSRVAAREGWLEARVEPMDSGAAIYMRRLPAPPKIKNGTARSALDALSLQIAILDTDGTILDVNDAWREFAVLNGMADHNFGVGQNYFSVCEAATGQDEEEAFAAASGIRGVIEGHKREFTLEYPCNAPQEPRWFMMRATRFENGGRAFIIVAHENVTERRLAEDALFEANLRLEATVGDQRRQLDEAHSDAQIVAEALAHDLRQPLRSIILAAREAAELGPRMTSQECAALLMRQEKAALRAAGLLDDLLTVIELTRAVPRPREVAVGEILEPLRLSLGLADHLKVQPDLTLYTDPLLLKVILFAWIDNAAKFAPNHEIRMYREGNDLVVHDQGHGFDEKYAEQIWRPWRRLVGESIPGRGAGLVRSRLAARRLGATVSAFSGRGVGAKFALHLPAMAWR